MPQSKKMDLRDFSGTQMPSAYADFGEIRSGYDARAFDNPMAIMINPRGDAGYAGIGFRQDAYIVGDQIGRD